MYWCAVSRKFFEPSPGEYRDFKGRCRRSDALHRRDCRLQAGRTAGSVPEEDNFDAIGMNAVVQVIADALQRHMPNELAGPRAPADTRIRCSRQQLPYVVQVFVECPRGSCRDSEATNVAPHRSDALREARSQRSLAVPQTAHHFIEGNPFLRLEVVRLFDRRLELCIELRIFDELSFFFVELLVLVNPAHTPLSYLGERLLLLRQQSRQPQIRQLLQHRVLAQPCAEVDEVDVVEVLVLVEAGEDERLLLRLRVDVALEALRADLLH